MLPPANPPLDICILWHMHQPLYEDPATGRALMPWVRLHALKDYYDMVALAAAHPGIQVTFNLVPVLLEQIQLAAEGSKPDRWLELARRKPEDLNETDRVFLIESFFSVNHDRVFSILPRMGELHAMAFPGDGSPARLASWTAGDWRDLQTLFHLAWCGNALQSEPLVRRLRSKGRAFTEEDKQALLDLQQEFLRKIIPAYLQARDNGRAELTTTPYYHPILPLLCDLNSVREATPSTPIPACPPRMPEDAREQIAAGIELFTEVTGQPPAGYWPSEGSLSDEVLDLLEGAGIQWAATDQELLSASLRAALKESDYPPPALSPFRFGDRKVAIFFRDRILSDLIGFTYASWNPSAAANDFVGRLRAIASRREPGRRGAVAVILDGENAWETYPKNGADFLDSLYGAIEAAPDLRAVTFSRHLREDTEIGHLPRLSAGSWIRGDLNTWIGHPEKNRAWELLASARAVFMAAGRPGGALRWLRAAQGSDWFWWFGDDHSSSQDSTFDQLFRAYLRQVYIACRIDPPPELSVAIKRNPGRRRVEDPTGAVTPTIDGRVTDYFEWLGAGSVIAEPSSAAIYASGAAVKSLQFGADGRALALRLDAIKPPFAETVDAGELVVAVVRPKPAGVVIPIDPSRTRPAGCEIASRKILEAIVPLALIDLAPGDRCEFTVTLRDRKGDPIATFPPEGTLTIRIPTPADASDDWSA